MKVASLLFSINDTLKNNYDELACLAQTQLETDTQFTAYLIEGQQGAEQMERAETQLIADIQKEIGDNEAKYLNLKQLLDQEPYESLLEESLDVVSLVSGDSSDEEDEGGEGEGSNQAPTRASTGSAARGWKKYEGGWIPRPIGVV